MAVRCHSENAQPWLFFLCGALNFLTEPRIYVIGCSGMVLSPQEDFLIYDNVICYMWHMVHLGIKSLGWEMRHVLSLKHPVIEKSEREDDLLYSFIQHYLGEDINATCLSWLARHRWHFKMWDVFLPFLITNVLPLCISATHWEWL